MVNIVLYDLIQTIDFILRSLRFYPILLCYPVDRSLKMTEFIREGLSIAIPFLIAIGKIAKKYGVETKWIQLLLLGIGIAIATVYGFVTSTLTGWRYFVDSLFITGLLQGAVVAFTYMGLYGTVKKAGKTKAALCGKDHCYHYCCRFYCCSLSIR